MADRVESSIICVLYEEGGKPKCAFHSLKQAEAHLQKNAELKGLTATQIPLYLLNDMSELE